jgi:hypothetical protein
VVLLAVENRARPLAANVDGLGQGRLLTGGYPDGRRLVDKAVAIHGKLMVGLYLSLSFSLSLLSGDQNAYKLKPV